MSEAPNPYWGNILKSNSNGTYFGISAENVNRDHRGYVDFEKMIGLDGIALVNVVSNPQEATLSGKKKLQSRITHNDGGTWKALTPPPSDSLGHAYECKSVVSTVGFKYTELADLVFRSVASRCMVIPSALIPVQPTARLPFLVF
jgi:hypothetical protein